MVKKSGLGKGLESLMGEATAEVGAVASDAKLPLSAIKPNKNQPRQSFEAEPLAELADSIKQNGVLQPIMVRKKGNSYVITKRILLQADTLVSSTPVDTVSAGKRIKMQVEQPDRGMTFSWGGGQPYVICPQRAYERFCTKDIPRMAAFGFRGIGYFDVVSILHAPVCRDPRHPCSRADSARWWGLCAEESRRALGGFSSEGAVDHFAGSLDTVLYASFDDPVKVERGEIPARSLAKRMIPVFQLVYNGIIAQNPYTATVNFPLKDRFWLLKFLECGGRPAFYFHSQFRADGGHWMGMTDLRCDTDEALRASAAKVREGWDAWKPFARLQYEFMDGHGRLAPDVFLTTWGDGTRLVTNYSAAPFDFEGRAVGPMDFLLDPPR